MLSKRYESTEVDRRTWQDIKTNGCNFIRNIKTLYVEKKVTMWWSGRKKGAFNELFFTLILFSSQV